MPPVLVITQPAPRPQRQSRCLCTLGAQTRACQVPGLAESARDSRPEIPDGIFLVRVDGAQFRWHAHKPFYVLRLTVLEPRTLVGQSIVGRLYCTQKAMWKLGWFLRDFLYDPELLAHEQVDERHPPVTNPTYPEPMTAMRMDVPFSCWFQILLAEILFNLALCTTVVQNSHRPDRIGTTDSPFHK